jgi:hypothetical protein
MPDEGYRSDDSKEKQAYKQLDGHINITKCSQYVDGKSQLCFEVSEILLHGRQASPLQVKQVNKLVDLASPFINVFGNVFFILS